jgi:uncharacterized membrane protein YfcA
MPDALTLVSLLAIGLAAGFLAGLLGIGGGVLIVPALVLLLGFDQHVAQGTSLVVIIPAALLGSWTHYRHRRLNVRDAAFVGAGGILGAAVGSLSALSIDDQLLQRLFAVVLIVVALRMIWSRRSPPEDASIGGVPEQD